MGLREYRKKREQPGRAPPAWPGAPGPMPERLGPALCTLVDAPPDGDGWLHEIKLDGYRAMAWLRGGRATVRSRSGLDWTARFPDIARALEALPVRDAILDGEIVAVDARGATDFGALQRWLGDASGQAGPEQIVYFLFDLPWAGGHDLRDTSLVCRKQALSSLLKDARPALRYMDHVSGNGPAFFAETCRHGLEGAVSKRAEARYPVGRSRDWLKAKCPRTGRFRVVGTTDPGGAREGFGALLVARTEDGQLRYAGRVGSGFGARELATIPPQLRGRASPPVSDPPTSAEARGVHWVEPDLEVEVAYTETTRDGRLRQPVFRGIVTPARPRLTNPDRVLWPGIGVTKRELAAWYAQAAPLALPHFVNRPLTLLRCPDGEGKPCFYQRHHKEALPDAIRSVVVPGHGEGEAYLWIDSLDGLFGLVQLGALEIHPWGARIDALDRPDRLVFDLDPDPGLPWSRLVEGAEAVRDRLAALGLESFARVTGGKGVHVVVPLEPLVGWPQAKETCRKVAEDIVRGAPDRYTSKMAKAQRKDRIFLDWLRNAQTATAVGSYSTRARPGAPVALPVRWEELAAIGRGDFYTLRTAGARLVEDPWPDFLRVRQSLTPEVLQALGVSDTS